MLCQSLLYSKVTQLYTYIHSFLMLFSIMVYHRILNRAHLTFLVPVLGLCSLEDSSPPLPPLLKILSCKDPSCSFRAPFSFSPDFRQEVVPDFLIRQYISAHFSSYFPGYLCSTLKKAILSRM